MLAMLVNGAVRSDTIASQHTAHLARQLHAQQTYSYHDMNSSVTALPQKSREDACACFLLATGRPSMNIAIHYA